MISCEPVPVDQSTPDEESAPETVNITAVNSSVQSCLDAVNEYHVDVPNGVQKRLHKVAENVEKLHTNYKKIENKNHKQKELIASVLQDFDKFSKKLETITSKTTKVKEIFEENKRVEVPKRKSSSKLMRKSHKKRNSSRLRIKAYVFEDSVKEKREKHIVKNLKAKDNAKKLMLEGKEIQNCSKMHGDAIGDSDNKSSLTCPDTIVTEIKDLRNIFNTLKKSVETDSTGGVKSGEATPLKMNATIVGTISSLISETILKILNKMMSEDFEQIKKDIDAIDSNWKLSTSTEGENTHKRQCDSWMMKAVTDQIENIQNQVEQISQTNKLLNDEMLRQKENIISLDGRINEITLPKQIHESETSKKGFSSLPGDQYHQNPDFWIAKLLRSVENLADQLKSEKLSLEQRDNKLTEANMREGVNKEEQNAINQSKICSPMNGSSFTEFPRETTLYKRRKSSAHVPSDNSTCSSDTKKTISQKVSSIRRMKRYGFSGQIYNAAKASSGGQSEYSRRPTRYETLSLRRPSKFSSSATNKPYHKKQPERSSTTRGKSFSPLLAPLFAADPNFVSDLIAKEVEKRIPELIRVNKIPRLLDEIAYQAINRYRAASGEVPFTVTRGKLTHQTPRINIRYLEIKNKSSLLRKNIFKTAREANDLKIDNSLPSNQSRKRVSNVDLRRRRTVSNGDSRKRELETQSQRNSDNKTSRGTDHLRDQRKQSYPNLHWKKENLELYSKEFLAAIKRSFVEIISNEIKKSVTGLVKQESSLIKEKESIELKKTSTTSLKPVWGSKSRELTKSNLVSELFINKSEQLHSSHDIESRTALTSQITLDCVQKFVAAIKAEKIQGGLLPEKEKTCCHKAEDKGQVCEPTECQIENLRQGSNIQPNLFVALPDIQILDTFWSGQILGSNTLPTKEMKTSIGEESNCCECGCNQNCSQLPLCNEPGNKHMSDTDMKNLSDADMKNLSDVDIKNIATIATTSTSTCKCSFEFSTTSSD